MWERIVLVWESIVVCVREFDWNGSEFDSSVPDWLTEEAVARFWIKASAKWPKCKNVNGSFWHSKYWAVISLWNLQRFCYAAFAQKNNLVACSRGRLKLREASSCERQFILIPGQSLRVVDVPETSEMSTQLFRIQNIIRFIKYSNLEHSGSSGGSQGALYLNNIVA